MARSQEPSSADELGAVRCAAEAISPAICPSRSQRSGDVAKPCFDEPDAGNPHVRISGSPGRQRPGPPGVNQFIAFSYGDVSLSLPWPRIGAAQGSLIMG